MRDPPSQECQSPGSPLSLLQAAKLAGQWTSAGSICRNDAPSNAAQRYSGPHPVATLERDNHRRSRVETKMQLYGNCLAIASCGGDFERQVAEIQIPRTPALKPLTNRYLPYLYGACRLSPLERGSSPSGRLATKAEPSDHRHSCRTFKSLNPFRVSFDSLPTFFHQVIVRTVHTGRFPRKAID